jgi:hypothetical protein
MHTLLRSSLVIVVASTLFACKPKPAPEAVAEAEPETEEEGSLVTDTMIEACQITLSEPESQQWTTYWDAAANPEGGPSPSSARSFHWADPDEKKLLIKQNLTTPLDIICGSNDDPAVYVSLSAFSSGERTIPMAAGSYDIVGKVSDELPPGQFQAGAILVGKDRFEAESGTLTIDRFDMSGVRGSFRIQGEDFTLEGSFEIPCRGGSPESLCEADKTIASE